MDVGKRLSCFITILLDMGELGTLTFAIRHASPRFVETRPNMETEKSFSIYVERAIIVYLHRKTDFSCIN